MVPPARDTDGPAAWNDCDDEMRDFHFEEGHGEDEELEREWWRQHYGHHQCQEAVLLEGEPCPLKLLCGHALGSTTSAVSEPRK